MADTSYRALVRSRGFGFLLLFCGGVWLFAADELILATLIPGILSDIGGANLVGLAGALFEAAAIVAGALSAFLVRKFGLRISFTLGAAMFALGCAISVAAPDMAVFQLGRFFQAMAGGGMVALTVIGIRNMFTSTLMARAMGVMSMVWGLAAFSGPLVGGLAAEYANWRIAFGYAGLLAAILAVISWIALGREARFLRAVTGVEEDFPLIRMVLLFGGVMALATAGVHLSAVWTPALLLLGAVLIGLFIRRDRALGNKRLLPAETFRPAGRVGPAVYATLFLCASNMGTQYFSPVLITALYGWTPLEIGYAMFLGAAGWTLSAATLSGTSEMRERQVIVIGFSVVVLATLGFNIAYRADLQWLLLAAYFFQGAGFGAAWTFVLRRTTKHPAPGEADRISAAMPTVQRAGLALGAAGFGIVANMHGFAEPIAPAAARNVAYWLMGLSTPLAVLGLVATLIFVRDDRAESATAEPARQGTP